MLPSKCDRFEVKSGDILYFNTWGGGGVGDPLTREAERVLKDVNSGLVSLEAANDIYGVVIANGAVDEAATEALRADKAANKSEAKLFNFGDELEELRANCLAETGLEPPAAPDFSKSRLAAE